MTSGTLLWIGITLAIVGGLLAVFASVFATRKRDRGSDVDGAAGSTSGHGRSHDDASDHGGSDSAGGGGDGGGGGGD